MTTIQLTQEQRDKLLEMTKSLFPDWELVSYDESFDDLTDGLVRFRQEKPEYKSKTFHWFEFVMTDLTDIIYKNIWKQMRKNNKLFDVITKEGFYTQVLHHKCEIIKHPVDYLYEQFKKLK